MEMKDIDLTKCNNCRAWVRYRYDRVYEGTGRIEKVTEEGGEVWMRFVSDEDGELITMWENGKICEHIMDFEIVPRDSETYRDWQVGDVIYSLDDEGNTVSGEDEMCRVIFRSGELVAIAENYSAEEADINGCYTCSQLFREGWRLVLTDIEQKIIEEKKKYEPQDGDVCYVETRSDHKSIFIYKKSKSKKTSYYVSYGRNVYERERLLSIAKPDVLCMVTDDCSITFLRPAKDEEQQKLFDAMAKQGKRWNAEKKVVEDIPKPYEFKKGEPVLVRAVRTHRWQLRAISLSVYGNPPKVEVTDGCDEWIYWIDKDEVIPYNEMTMHLLGTTEDYKEE